MSTPPWRSAGKAKTGMFELGSGVLTSTAYTQVSSNRTISRPPSNPSPPAPTNDGEADMPESLKRFVSRCLEDGKHLDNEKLQQELKAVVTKAFSEGTVWQIDWDSVTLPLLEPATKKRPPPSPMPSSSQNNNKKQKSKTSTSKKSNTFELSESEDKRLKRQRRFESSSNSTTPSWNDTPSTPPANRDEPLVGTSTKLEKRYLRLTSDPDPSTVRPLPVLKQTLELLKGKWRSEQNYAYICDQFKSLRQDLTVQHIQNEFTVLVYEIHARIALERSDLGEYNQCQSQLNYLYAQGLPGNVEEFLAYRVLYLCHTQNHAEIGHLLVDLSDKQEAHPAVRHALRVHSVMVSQNYHLLFKLYVNAPNMGGYVMDSFVTRERLSALSSICRAYRPSIGITFVAKELGFMDGDEGESHSGNDCIEWLNQYVKVEDGATVLATKESFPHVDAARQQAYSKVDIKGQI